MDLSFFEQHSRGIVVLHETKSVQRTASSETVVIFDAYLVRMLATVCRDLAPSEFLVGCSPAIWVKFARLVHEAGLPKCNWKLYSLRCGGVTTDFHTNLSSFLGGSIDDPPFEQHPRLMSEVILSDIPYFQPPPCGRVFLQKVI